jgi:lysophosphatidylcholine acyltransferase/lyso-PAF acetyltransferase
MTTYEYIKCILMFPIAITRILLITLILMIQYVIARCGNGNKICKTIILALFRLEMFVIGFYHVSSTVARSHESSHKRANIIVANHISIFEALYLIYEKGACAVAKEEGFHYPILGTILKALDFIPAKRETKEGRKKAIETIINRVKSTTTDQAPLLIFPQGTTVTQRYMSSFKNGAFLPGESVQPVLARYHYRHWDMYFGDHVLVFFARTLCQFVNTLSVEYLPVYNPSEEERKDPSLYAENVRKAMAVKMGSQLVDVTLEDYHRAKTNS